MMEFARDWKDQKPSLIGRLLGRPEKAPDSKQREEEFLRLAKTVAERYSNFLRL